MSIRLQEGSKTGKALQSGVTAHMKLILSSSVKNTTWKGTAENGICGAMEGQSMVTQDLVFLSYRQGGILGFLLLEVCGRYTGGGVLRQETQYKY